MPLNAVERRLVDLRRQWERFAHDPTPRLLVWTVPDAAMRLVRCFLEVQKHEGEYVTGDLFIVFDTPFENSIQYSRALKEALAGQHAASASDFEREGLDPRWPVDPASFPDSAYGFIKSLCSLGGKYHAAIGHLVAVLAPSAVSNDAHFSAWIERALAAGVPERLRLLALDSLEASRLAGLEPAQLVRLRRETLEIDATAVAAETFAQERTVGPAGVFRNMLMALVALAEKGSAADAQAKAADALAFAEERGWREQQAVVSMLVAGALLKEKRFDEAIAAYRDARAAAVMAEWQGHPAGASMILQTWFSEAGVALAAGRVPEAAAAYDQAGKAAEAARNLILAMEAHRMTAFCHARLGEREEAVAWGYEALAVGARLRPEVRGMTTMPLAASDLLRTIDEGTAQAIDVIGQQATRHVATLGDEMEQQAIAYERTVASGATRTAEQTLARDNQSLAERVERDLQGVVSRSGEDFQHAFAQGRALLGSAWPMAGLASGLAAPPAVREPEAAAS
jgi:hypothetical protein